MVWKKSILPLYLFYLYSYIQPMQLADLTSEQPSQNPPPLSGAIPDLSVSQVHAQPDDNQQQQQSFFQRHKLSPNKIFKVFLLSIMLLIILWFFATSFEVVLFEAKQMVKVKVDQPIEEFSGLDEEGYRSYYYFRQMEAMARDLVREDKDMDFALAKNRFGDISFSQIFGLFKVLKAVQYAKGYTPSSPQTPQSPTDTQAPDTQLLSHPSNYSSYFLPVANQYKCASCYSFPITATIEYLYSKYLNISVKLSEQQLIDCSGQDQLIDGCKSGNITEGFQYAMRVGLVEQEAYPYRSKTGHSYACRKDIVEDDRVKKYKIEGFRMLPTGSCQAIQVELNKGHTVAAMIAAGELSYYGQSETRAFRNCPKEPFNHAITIVGQTERKEWIIRNSWGASFGQNGYFIMKGGNTCGVCTHGIVPYLKENQ